MSMMAVVSRKTKGFKYSALGVGAFGYGVALGNMSLVLPAAAIFSTIIALGVLWLVFELIRRGHM